MQLELHGESWRVYRRFREFFELNEYLKLLYPGIVPYVRFPPKKLWPTAAFLAQRRVDLEIYLRELVARLHAYPRSVFFNTRREALARSLAFFRAGDLTPLSP